MTNVRFETPNAVELPGYSQITPVELSAFTIQPMHDSYQRTGKAFRLTALARSVDGILYIAANTNKTNGVNTGTMLQSNDGGDLAKRRVPSHVQRRQ